jgi:hypothetical protein
MRIVMLRNLKTLGLAFVVVLAMIAMAASAASASQYTASAYPATATGSNTAGNETFTTPGGTVQCDSHFQGTLAGASSSLKITPKYTNCTAFGFLNATVHFIGCWLISYVGVNHGGGVYTHIFDIGCEPGAIIIITAGTCEVKIPAQTGLSSTQTTNLAGGTLTVQPNLKNITMNVTKDGFGCPFPSTGHTTGSYHGDVVLSRVGGGSISASGS